MSLKKRMFRSNMTILFATLFSLMLIILGVLDVDIPVLRRDELGEVC